MQEAIAIIEAKALRSILRSNPDISGSEFKTVSILADFFSKFRNLRIIKNIGGNSHSDVFSCKLTGPNNVLGSEFNAVSYSNSTIDTPLEIHHSCGHNFHLATFDQLATLLEDSKELSGNKMLLFQKAEETCNGSNLVINNDLNRLSQVSNAALITFLN